MLAPHRATSVNAIRRLLAVALLAMAFQAGWAAPLNVAVGEYLPPATVLRGLNTPDRTLAAYRGKPLVINVWASWCGPCRQEMGSLERLAWSPEGQQFAVIGISTDDSRDAARQFITRSNSTLNHYLDDRLALENLLGANRLPLTLLVSAQGKVLSKTYGAAEWDSAAMRGAIRKYFALTR
jgi:thiol-disulfide isomerase/thioredoxin